MKPDVWLLGPPTGFAPLEAALRARGFPVKRAPFWELAQVAVAVYDGRGLMVVDAREAEGSEVLARQDAALVPVLAVADAGMPLPAGVFRLLPEPDPVRMAHHVAEVLAEPRNLRRHPRFPTNRQVQIDGVASRLHDVSLYGVWVEPAGSVEQAQRVVLEIPLVDQATIHLDGVVVARRGSGAAVRVRPVSDQDLLLWVHLLLDGLVDSPLHGGDDVLGGLFAEP